MEFSPTTTTDIITKEYNNNNNNIDLITNNNTDNAYHTIPTRKQTGITITVRFRGICWISNNNTLDIPCTPNAQEARRPLFEFDFTITIPVI